MSSHVVGRGGGVCTKRSRPSAPPHCLALLEVKAGRVAMSVVVKSRVIAMRGVALLARRGCDAKTVRGKSTGATQPNSTNHNYISITK